VRSTRQTTFSEERSAVRIHKVLYVLTLLALCAVMATAADVSGKWTAQIPGMGGELMDFTFNLKATGEKVTGTVSMPFGDQDISEGKIVGDDISFVTAVEFGDMKIKTTYRGKVAGAEMKLTSEMQFSGTPPEGGPGGGPPKPGSFTAKKVG
jgi:hypothetical protein